jgi:hypothetical protein
MKTKDTKGHDNPPFTFSYLPEDKKQRSNREAQRRWRNRQRAEIIVRAYRLFLSEDAVAEYMIDSGRLSPQATLDRSKVERALELIINEAMRKPR